MKFYFSSHLGWGSKWHWRLLIGQNCHHHIPDTQTDGQQWDFANRLSKIYTIHIAFTLQSYQMIMNVILHTLSFASLPSASFQIKSPSQTAAYSQKHLHHHMLHCCLCAASCHFHTMSLQQQANLNKRSLQWNGDCFHVKTFYDPSFTKIHFFSL